MANGQQLAEHNFQVFTTWLSSQTEEDFRQMVMRGSLSRKEIAAQCRFAVSVLNQNPRIKSALLAKEASLRESGVLPTVAIRTDETTNVGPDPEEPSSTRRSFYAERLRRLEQENAILRAENSELKRALESHAVIREVLSMTGRVPR
jgi:hypothetical protein